MVVGVRALAALDPDRYALTVVNQVLGGGMSSRLFQEIREQRASRTRFLVPGELRRRGVPRDLRGNGARRLPETLA